MVAARRHASQRANPSATGIDQIETARRFGWQAFYADEKRMIALAKDGRRKLEAGGRRSAHNTGAGDAASLSANVKRARGGGPPASLHLTASRL